jgi:ribosomal protein S18 acetylase RimI-like enzyme
VRGPPAALEVRHPRDATGLRTGVVTFEVRPLTGETWDALAELFREGGDPRWCWCQFWRLRSKDMAAAKVPELRERLHGQARSTEPPGLVAFDGDRAVGWVSLGPRTDFERIVRSRVIPTVDDRPVWSIVCFAVSSAARGRGVARALLEAAVDYAGQRGAEALEAYPVATDAGEPIQAEAAFTGTLPMFERAGFRVVADRASDPSSRHRRVVVRRDLAPSPSGSRAGTRPLPPRSQRPRSGSGAHRPTPS